MRMGKPERKRRGQAPSRTVMDQMKGAKKDEAGPMFAAPASVVGELSPDIIKTYFVPKLGKLATERLERHADDLMHYEDALREYQNEKKKMAEEQVEIAADGTTTQDATATDRDPPVPPLPPIYRSQHWVNELAEVLNETSDHFQSKSGAWKVHLRAARFERNLDEKYGILRPFITSHPEVEHFVRSVQRKYAMGYFSPFRQGKPPIPKTTAVILLFMMQRGNLGWQVMTLATLFFLVGLQPWALVVIVAGFQQLLDYRRKRPIKPMARVIPAVEPYYSSADDDDDEDKAKRDLLLTPIGKKMQDSDLIDASKYDTIILGSGPATLYTASLMSRAGRKVLVLCPRDDASGCFTIDGSKKFESVPFDVESSNVAKIKKQQELLAPALSTTTDYQGGVRFSQIGTEADGHAFEILSVPGMGTESGKPGVPFVLRASGNSSLMEDASMFLGDGYPGLHGEVGNSTVGSYLDACDAINASSMAFFMSKIFSDKVNDIRSKSTYQESAIRYASSFLDKCFPYNAHTRSLMAAIGMKGEDITPSMTSMGAHVTNICSAMTGEGMHYPIGGPRALCHAFANVVEQNGGSVVTHAPVVELLFDLQKNIDESNEEDAPQCIGVKLADKREIKFDPSQFEDGVSPSPVVVSMHGFVTTFIRFLPDEIRSKFKVPRGLPALTERRPVFKALIGLNGSAADLNITGADFYRVPGASLAQDMVDSATGQIQLGEIGKQRDYSVDIGDGIAVEEINKEDGDESGEQNAKGPVRPKKARTGRNKFDAGRSWLQISFPSAKDPSFESRHGKISTCVVTVEADDDFVTLFDTKPRLYAIQKGKGAGTGEQQRLIERIRKDLLGTYPQLEDKIECIQLVGPLHRGLSHNPERFAAKGVRADSPYPGLFVGGSDLTVGESFSASIVGGWLAANAVMGYSPVDYLFLQKNITSDISQFLEHPDIPDEPDLAVPYGQRSESPVADVVADVISTETAERQ